MGDAEYGVCRECKVRLGLHGEDGDHLLASSGEPTAFCPDVWTDPAGATEGTPDGFYEPSPKPWHNRPLGSLVRDDRVWVCPAAMLPYGNEIAFVDDTYLDTDGNGPSLIPIGAIGRYCSLVIGPNTEGGGRNSMSMLEIPLDRQALFLPDPSIGPGTGAQVRVSIPTKLALCGCFGTASGPGSLGPDGSDKTRHSARW